jgi:hypothetical protein
VTTRRTISLPDFVVKDFEALTEWDHVHALKVYLTCLMRAGWTGKSISRSLGRNRNWGYHNYLKDLDIDKSIREYRLITGLGLTVPPVPKKIKPVKVNNRLRKKAKPETLERLVTLREKAKNYRGWKRNEEEAQEYVALIWKTVTEEGVSTYSLAKDLDVI